MKLSEIDKSKLPIKIMRGGLLYTVKYIGDYYAILTNDLGAEITFDISYDIWSPYQEPKPKVALYRYKGKTTNKWYPTDVYCLDDDDFKNQHRHMAYTEFERLIWSEVEV